MKWLFENTGYLSGKEQMDLDISNAQKLAADNNSHSPLLRIYGWKPWAISLGKNQSDTSINYQECSIHGIDIVRRPTGGRAVLHANELTYCITVPCKDTSIAKKWYESIHLFLLRALSPLHISHLDFVKSQTNFTHHYATDMSKACFSTSAQYEVEYKGKKIIGSAQMIHDNVLLQHGSILLQNDHLAIAGLITKNDNDKISLYEYLDNSSIDLSTILNRTVTYEECVHLIYNEFMIHHSIPFL